MNDLVVEGTRPHNGWSLIKVPGGGYEWRSPKYWWKRDEWEQRTEESDLGSCYETINDAFENLPWEYPPDMPQERD